MGADQRRPGDSSQVEDRVEGAERPAGYGAGSEGGGSEVWEREPAAAGGWEMFGTRGGERDRARRRVEARPEVMPPHPRPVDRTVEKQRAERSFATRALPVAAGLFAIGYFLPAFFGRSRRELMAGRARMWAARKSAPPVTLALRTKGWRGRRDAMRLAELLRGERFRGEVIFE